MSAPEAQARLKINKLLEESGWRFFEDEHGPANVVVEAQTSLTKHQVDAFGEDFQAAGHGFIDFLLLDPNGFPLAVLEAKKEALDPLVGKEQARKYAREQNCRFVILSNGRLHYLWDLDHGNPHLISKFPDASEFKDYKKFEPNPQKLAAETVESDFIALSQLPGYAKDADWKDETSRKEFVEKNKLRFMREYQVKAIRSLQKAVSQKKDRFLFEMATGTGKTLTSAAVIRLFLKTGNARRVLFLVDRIELENQAQAAFTELLKNDYKTVIYKERKNDWRKAEIVVTTVQSLLFNNKYRDLFAPTDFDLVISDEAHRSIGGNARAVFEYFVGYKLGLTATPKAYLRNFDPKFPTSNDPREAERRMMLDTYRTFGCEDSDPTFRYSLLDGVKDGFLINPYVVDARTEITTELLSKEGYAAVTPTEDGEQDETYISKDFEKRFFSEPTNRTFCKVLMENALRDPFTDEIGKTLVFAVSQKHATKLVQILNEYADTMFPGKYQSDFAVQVTSQIPDAQKMTMNFKYNTLLGSANFDPEYKTSKARVCVTVGMMTTGYDCEDLLNIALMRPVFSPSDFVQIKGRGTRTHNHLKQLQNKSRHDEMAEPEKKKFKFFDFFANCQYFEEEFNYDEEIELPRPGRGRNTLPPDPPPPPAGYENVDADDVKTIAENQVGAQGMKIDRMMMAFEETIKQDIELQKRIEADDWDAAIQHVIENVFEKPNNFFNLDKLRKSIKADRRLTLREILEKVTGRIERFKTKDELLNEEFDKLVLDLQIADSANIPALKYYFKAYLTDRVVRDIIEDKDFARLNTNPTFNVQDYTRVPPEWRTKVPEYVKDYVNLNQFTD